jgi:branched-chain amino acid transport system substrate-binding protein
MRRARSARIALALLTSLSSAPAHAADVVIGVGLPLSGPKRALGEGMRLALERDAADLNARGGILGSPVRLIFADDGCQPSPAETAARTLLAEAPAVVIGHPCSGAALSASKIYAAAPGTLFIAAGARHPALTDASRQPGPQTVFRLAGRDDQQGRAGATWLLKNAPAKRIAIIHDRTAYAREIADDARQALKEAGIAEVPVLTLVAGKAAYPEVQSELKKIEAEAVLFAGYPDEAVIVLGAARREGSRVAFLGSDSLATPEFARRVAGDRAVRALFRLEPGDIADEGAGGPMARRAEAALEVWGRAVGAANSLDQAAVAAALRGGDFETRALGRVSFDARGDSREPSFGPAEAAGEHWRPGSE